MKKFLSNTIFKIIGWKVDSNIDTNLVKKAVLVSAPHTSNWDFFLMLFGVWKMNVNVNFMIKDSFFVFPTGNILNWLGGVPVNRSKARNVVSQISDKLKNKEIQYLVISAEGTRSYTEKWKSGFYRIAQKSDAPLYFGFIDYRKKVVGISKEFKMTGDYDNDLVEIKKYFSKVTPKFPELFSYK